MRGILIKTIQKTPFMAETVIIKKLKPSLQMTSAPLWPKQCLSKN